MGGPSAKVGRKKQYFSYKKGAREFWGRGGQLILINLVPSGDFSSLFRLKFARVEKERARELACPFPIPALALWLSPHARSHKGEHRSYKNERARGGGGLQSGTELVCGGLEKLN